MNVPTKLDSKSILQQRDVAKNIVKDLSDEEMHELEVWCNGLIEIRQSSNSNIEKIKLALSTTFKASNIFSIFKLISQSIKKYAWDDRKVKGRLGLLGIGVGVMFFAGQAAGIAALGSAVGIPLWVVFGAGGTFVGFIVEEIERSRAILSRPIIDADFEEIEKET